MDARGWRMSQRRRHLHRLHHAWLPRHVHAFHGRAFRRPLLHRGAHGKQAFGLGKLFDQPGMAKILGIPDAWDQTCLIPVGYATGDDFTPSPRGSVDDVIVWNHGPLA